MRTLRKISPALLALSLPVLAPAVAQAKVDMAAVQQQSAQLGATLSLIDASFAGGTLNVPWAIDELTQKQAGLTVAADKLARAGLFRYLAAGLFGAASLGMGGVTMTGAGMVTGGVGLGSALLAYRTFTSGRNYRKLAATLKKQVADATAMVQRLTSLQSSGQELQPRPPVAGVDAPRLAATAQAGPVYYFVDARQQVYAAPYGKASVSNGPSGQTR